MSEPTTVQETVDTIDDDLLLDISNLLEPHEVESLQIGTLKPEDYTVLPLQATHIESRKNPQGGGGRLVICVYEVQAGVFENDTALFLGSGAETEFLLEKIAFAPSIRLVVRKNELTESTKEILRSQLRTLVHGIGPAD